MCTYTFSAGVTTQSPASVDLSEVDEAADIKKAWVLSGAELFHDCQVVVDDYCLDLDDVPLGARVALRVTSNGELHFALNGVDLGCVISDIPQGLFVCCLCCCLPYRTCRSLNSFIYLAYMYTCVFATGVYATVDVYGNCSKVSDDYAAGTLVHFTFT